MAERIMEIILFVISSIRGSNIAEVNISELEKLGYTKSEISTAFSWLAEKVESAGTIEPSPYLMETKGFRVLHSAEKDLFTKSAYGELIQYLTLGLISNPQLELLIDRAIISGISEIDSSILKNYIAALHFENFNVGNVPGRMLLIGNDTIN
jgi:uncharacterized protein Smg (DUF494 family)